MKRQKEINGKQFVNHGSIFERHGSLFEANGSIFERHGRPFEGYNALKMLKSYFSAGEFYAFTNEALNLNFKFYFK